MAKRLGITWASLATSLAQASFAYLRTKLFRNECQFPAETDVCLQQGRIAACPLAEPEIFKEKLATNIPTASEEVGLVYVLRLGQAGAGDLASGHSLHR